MAQLVCDIPLSHYDWQLSDISRQRSRSYCHGLLSIIYMEFLVYTHNWKLESEPYHHWGVFLGTISMQRCRDHFGGVPSQWEMTWQCYVISHWLGTCTKWSLKILSFWYRNVIAILSSHWNFHILVRRHFCIEMMLWFKNSQQYTKVSFVLKEFYNSYCQLFLPIGWQLLVFLPLHFITSR